MTNKQIKCWLGVSIADKFLICSPKVFCKRGKFLMCFIEIKKVSIAKLFEIDGQWLFKQNLTFTKRTFNFLIP